MGYEDGKVDQQKRKYGNARRLKVKLSKNYFKIHNDSNDYANNSKSNQKSSKKKNKVQKLRN